MSAQNTEFMDDIEELACVVKGLTCYVQSGGDDQRQIDHYNARIEELKIRINVPKQH